MYRKLFFAAAITVALIMAAISSYRAAKDRGANQSATSLFLYQKDILDYAKTANAFLKTSPDPECAKLSFIASEFERLSPSDRNIVGGKLENFEESMSALRETLSLARELARKANQKAAERGLGPGSFCLPEKKKLIVVLRYTMDSLLAWKYDLYRDLERLSWSKGQLTRPANRPAEERFYDTEKGRFGQSMDLRSGDVIISLEDFVSSFFGHISKAANPFSHSMMVYTPEGGKVYKIDTLYKQNAQARPLDVQNLLARNARLMHLRYQDPELAKLSAKYLYDKISRLKEEGKLLPFDLYVKNGNDAYSCIELLRLGFSKASKGAVKIPLNRSLSSPEKMTLWDFVLDGQAPKDVYLPGDLEWDGRFEALAEYRNLDLLVQAFYFDAMTLKIIDLANSSLFKGLYALLKDKYGAYQKTETNVTLGQHMLIKVFNHYLKELTAFSMEIKQTNGVGPTYFMIRNKALSLSAGLSEIRSLFEQVDNHTRNILLREQN